MTDTGFYHAFEGAFRGSREEIRIRLKSYLPLLTALRAAEGVPDAALDLGCGRGEWLELLSGLGFAARGVDLDATMLADARARGLDVTECDAPAALEAAAPGSLAVVSAFHLVEHVPFEAMVRLVEGARRALAPGGLMLIETPNPENVEVATVTFHNDPTHRSPVPPNVLAFLAERAGFAQVGQWRVNERPDVAGGSIRLRDVFAEVSPDYAILAQTDGPDAIRAALGGLIGMPRGLRLPDLADRFERRFVQRVELMELSMEVQRVGHHLRHDLAGLRADQADRAEARAAELARLRGEVAALRAAQADEAASRVAEDTRLGAEVDALARRLKAAEKTLDRRISVRVRRRVRKILGQGGRKPAPPAPPPETPAAAGRHDPAPAASAADADVAPGPEAAGPVAEEPAPEAAGAPEAEVPPPGPWRMPLQQARPAAGPLPERLRWRLEGPLDSSYSLALVNRELARALAGAGVEVSLVSAEGPGPITPDPAFLAANPDIAGMLARGDGPADLVTRNMYPPRVADIGEGPAGLHSYAWEEGAVPDAWVAAFNAHLSAMTVTSAHVRKVMIDNGVALPIHAVGNGVDHLQRIDAVDPPVGLPQAGTLFVHVSSCFPRKGADALLAAWRRAFGPDDDVALVIKTFDNPHNDIAERLAALRAERAALAPVEVIRGDWSAGAMRGLYRAADVVVLPSRAEGFCLPVAEAALEGARVIATGWSGTTEFAGCPLVELSGYRLSRAETHIGQDDSVWAEPDVDDLVARMRAARAAGPPDPAQVQAARDWLLPRMSWQAVARRSVEAMRAAAAVSVAPPTIGWVSTFNARCGIATYSAHLIAHMGLPVHVLAAETAAPVEPDGALEVPLTRCWREDGRDPLLRLAVEIARHDFETVVIQFNYSFYDFESLGRLIVRLKDEGRQVVVMMHGTDDARAPADRQVADIRHALARCERLIVHKIVDLERLRALGLVENVALMPHGVLPVADLPEPPPLEGRELTLGSYGFLLPNKGLPELIEAVALLREGGRNVNLALMNAEYPREMSRALLERCYGSILARGLAPFVRLDARFRPDGEVLADLARCDLLVYPYQESAESASGAVRYGLAAGRPVAVTPLDIFSDVADMTLRLPGRSPEAMAEGLAPVIDRIRAGETYPGMRRRARAECDRLAYTRLAPRLGNILISLNANRA